MRLVQGQESVWLLFKLRTGFAGLLKSNKRCRMVSDESCVCLLQNGGECDSFLGGLWGSLDRLAGAVR